MAKTSGATFMVNLRSAQDDPTFYHAAMKVILSHLVTVLSRPPVTSATTIYSAILRDCPDMSAYGSDIPTKLAEMQSQFRTQLYSEAQQHKCGPLGSDYTAFEVGLP
jgi:predicted short-subunit dehydrogenase-like oxidoreductase (DUF2520 family)